MVITDDQTEPADAEKLLPQARAGDAQAFSVLTQPLQARLFRQAIALTRDVSAAEDLVSETLVAAWKSLSRYNETCRLSTWLYAILMHRYQESMRRARRRPISLAWLPFFQAQELHDQHANVSSAEPSPFDSATQKEAANR